MESLKQTLNALIAHWAKQGIKSNGKTIGEIQAFESRLNIVFPDDFRLYFKEVNGMGNNYLTDTDDNGFSFYQLEDIRILTMEFKLKESAVALFSEGRYLITFADYLQKSWSYAVSINATTPNDYLIFTFIDFEKYKIITNSLSDFIDLYISDSWSLYET